MDKTWDSYARYLNYGNHWRCRTAFYSNIDKQVKNQHALHHSDYMGCSKLFKAAQTMFLFWYFIDLHFFYFKESDVINLHY